MIPVSMQPREKEEILWRWMEEHKNHLMRLCTAYLRDAALAEDAVQETFLRAYRGMDAFRRDSQVRTWLVRIAINTCKNMRKERWFRLVDRRVDFESMPLAAPEQADLMTEIWGLPIRYREVILLHYYEGLSVREMSEMLGVKPSTLCSRLKRGREKLRVELEGGECDDE